MYNHTAVGLKKNHRISGSATGEKVQIQ